MKQSCEINECITEEEAEYILTAIESKKPDCPDCKIGYLLTGPEGGCSINVRCDACGSKFNLMFLGRQVIGQRLSERQ